MTTILVVLAFLLGALTGANLAWRVALRERIPARRPLQLPAAESGKDAL